eukprot:170863_1
MSGKLQMVVDDASLDNVIVGTAKQCCIELLKNNDTKSLNIHSFLDDIIVGERAIHNAKRHRNSHMIPFNEATILHTLETQFIPLLKVNKYDTIEALQLRKEVIKKCVEPSRLATMDLTYMNPTE